MDVRVLGLLSAGMHLNLHQHLFLIIISFSAERYAVIPHVHANRRVCFLGTASADAGLYVLAKRAFCCRSQSMFFSYLPSYQVTVCSWSKVDRKVFSSVHCFFLLRPSEVDMTKKKGSQEADCWVFLANNRKTLFYFSLAVSHSLIIFLSFSPTHVYSSQVVGILFAPLVAAWKRPQSKHAVQSKRICDDPTHQYKSLVQKLSLNINGNWSEMLKVNERSA